MAAGMTADQQPTVFPIADGEAGAAIIVRRTTRDAVAAVPTTGESRDEGVRPCNSRAHRAEPPGLGLSREPPILAPGNADDAAKLDGCY